MRLSFKIKYAFTLCMCVCVCCVCVCVSVCVCVCCVHVCVCVYMCLHIFIKYQVLWAITLADDNMLFGPWHYIIYTPVSLVVAVSFGVQKVEVMMQTL